MLIGGKEGLSCLYFAEVLGDRELLTLVEASIKRFAVASHMLDGVGDWREDLDTVRKTTPTLGLGVTRDEKPVDPVELRPARPLPSPQKLAEPCVSPHLWEPLSCSTHRAAAAKASAEKSMDFYPFDRRPGALRHLRAAAQLEKGN